MLHSLPADVLIIVLSFAAAVSSQPLSLYQQCWQTSVLQPASGVPCSKSDFQCICTSLNTRLESFLSCVDDTSQTTSPTPQGIRRAINSILESCSNIRDNESPTARSYAHLQNALQPANEDHFPPQELKARSTLETGSQLEKRYIVVPERASTSAKLVAARAITSIPPLAAAPTPVISPTPTPTPTPTPILNNGMGTSESLIPIYTDTPPLIVTDGATGTVSPTAKPTGSANGEGGTLLDMTSAAANGKGGGQQNKMLGLVVCLVACVVWF